MSRAMKDPDTTAQVLEALEGADAVDARRVTVDLDDGHIVLRGWVASPEEAQAAIYIAEATADLDVVDELQIDRGLREGAKRATDVERVRPMEDEVLVGDPDMLSGARSDQEDDIGRAMDESLAWTPPEVPVIPPTAAEQAGGGSSQGGTPPTPDDDAGEPGPAAPDLSATDIASGRLPSLDDEGSASSTGDSPAVDALGRAPDDESLEDRMVDRLPGASAGDGAMSESALEGGSTGATPATETGAAGADAGTADPARTTGGNGGNAEGTGARRGPPSREDPAVREDLPDDE